MADTPDVLDVIEAFIAGEVGEHLPGMRGQAADLLTALSDAGYVVVKAYGLNHGDELPSYASCGLCDDRGFVTNLNILGRAFVRPCPACTDRSEP